MLVDMHLHALPNSTDSFLTLEEIVSLAKLRGLDAICLTDHDSMGGREYAAEYSRKTGFPIFVGVEYYSLWGDITAWASIPSRTTGEMPRLSWIRSMPPAASAYPAIPSGTTSGALRTISGMSGDSTVWRFSTAAPIWRPTAPPCATAGSWD